MARVSTALVLSLFMTITVGCGGNDLGLVPVEGIVTLDGEPLSNASIIFYPAAGGRLSNGRTDSEGRYSLEYVEGESGALPGTHKVVVSTFIEADPDSANPLIKRGQREAVPAEYNTKTTLQAELESGGSETLDFHLKSSNRSLVRNP